MRHAKKTALGFLLTIAIIVSLCLGNFTAKQALGENQSNSNRTSQVIPTLNDDHRDRMQVSHDEADYDEDFDEDYDDGNEPDEDYEREEDYEEEEEEEEEDDDFERDDYEDYADEIENEFAEAKLSRAHLKHSVRLATGEVYAAVYAIEMLTEFAEPEVAKRELTSLLAVSSNPEVQRAIRIGLMHVNAELDDVESTIELAKQLIAGQS